MEPLRRIIHHSSAPEYTKAELFAAAVIGAVNDTLRNLGSPLADGARAVSFQHHRVTIEVGHAAVAAIVRARAADIERVANELLARRVQNPAATVTDIRTRVV